MTTAQQLEFQTRLHHLLRKHRAMARGYTTRMRSDGLIVARPRRNTSPISGRTMLICLIAFIAFKGVVIASLGEAAYNDRLTRLEQGSIVEQAGALAMQPDPISQLIAAQLATRVR